MSRQSQLELNFDSAAFRSALHVIRRRETLSFSEMGAKIGVHGSSVSNWERGMTTPSGECARLLIERWPELEGIITPSEGAKPGGAPQRRGHRTPPTSRSAPAHPPIGRGRRRAEERAQSGSTRAAVAAIESVSPLPGIDVLRAIVRVAHALSRFDSIELAGLADSLEHLAGHMPMDGVVSVVRAVAESGGENGA